LADPEDQFRRLVLELLAGALAAEPLRHKYSIVHADTGDVRGIDVAFLYDATC
jgi:hypothetical protein